MKYYIIAGEPSGDLHASNLMKGLKKQDTEAAFRCWGGDLMKAQGGEIVKHYRDLAFMGFVEVLIHLRTITGNIRFCKNDLLEYRPDVLILVDYPGFNLRIARFAKKAGIRVVYYISPQLWAWNASRVKTIRSSVDKMLVILPFEKDFYKKYRYEAEFTGHPLLDVLYDGKQFISREEFLKKNNLPDMPFIALLPGSRKQEIRHMLPVMLSVCKDFPQYRFIVAGAPSQNEEFYHEMMGECNVPVVRNQTYDLLHHSEAALVTSGTATLETALMNVPQVVCYRGNFLSYLVARQLISVKFISLVNLIMDKMIVKELIQNDLNKKNIILELKKILFNEAERNKILTSYDILKEKLGGTGASERAAGIITHFIRTPKLTEQNTEK